PDDILVSFINYLADYQTEEISEYFLDLIEEDSNAISIAAITALGKSNLSNISDTLIEYLEDSLFEDLRKPALIESLGKLKAIEALEVLTDIATDVYSENSSLRWRAVIALGEIGSEESLPVLKSLFTDTDPYLRNYTITALKHYPSKDVKDLLIQGLKDSSWRVRVNAAQSLGELGIIKSVPILIYKAENDPDIRNVRAASVKALGEIGGKEAYNFIRELYKNERTDHGLRSLSIEVLAENDLSNSINIIKSVFDKEWDKNKSSILDYTCKILSTTNSSSLKELYSRMLNYDKTLNLKLYALRGIRLNSFSSFKEEVEALTSDETPRVIRKLAIDVLGEL
ncbi:MAG: HEAT repeat domain-containing protein, partial [Spirochaetales bacterium]|nr:HEAT repeat domain-containing protein [Spirochaetales bacterium]